MKIRPLSHLITLTTTLLVSASAFANSPLLITGKIASSKIQYVTAPKTDRFQIQIQWMADEGTMVDKGELIAVFDSGSTDSQLEQNEENLQTQTLELESQTIELDQAVLEAEGALTVAELEVKKARIEAEIQSDDISEYDKGEYQIVLERALVDRFKAEQALKKAKENRTNTLEKLKIEIIKIEDNITYYKNLLSVLQVKAQFAGMISHMYHPWEGEKITAGSTLQVAMKAMAVQDTKAYAIEAWIHEVDAVRIHKGQTANITLDAYPGSHYQAKVTRIASQPESKNNWGSGSYFPIQLSFVSPPQEKLLPGMSTRIELTDDMEVSRHED